MNVKAAPDGGRGIPPAGHEIEVLEDLDDKMSRYTIPLHRWVTVVSYKNITGIMKMTEKDSGYYQNIIKSCRQAKEDGYKWLWIDTYCNDK